MDIYIIMADTTISKADELQTAGIESNLIQSAANKKRHRPRTKALRSQLKIEVFKFESFPFHFYSWKRQF